MGMFWFLWLGEAINKIEAYVNDKFTGEDWLIGQVDVAALRWIDQSAEYGDITEEEKKVAIFICEKYGEKVTDAIPDFNEEE